MQMWRMSCSDDGGIHGLLEVFTFQNVEIECELSVHIEQENEIS